MKIIALVTVAVFVAGARVEFKAGEEVTGLNPVDTAELKRIGAIEDQEEVDAGEKASKRADKVAGKEFADARKAILDSQAALEAPAA